jgi:hypothetical protein
MFLYTPSPLKAGNFRYSIFWFYWEFSEAIFSIFMQPLLCRSGYAKAMLDFSLVSFLCIKAKK